MNLFESFDIGIGKKLWKASHPSAAWVHQIHAAAGVGGSTTMVMVFVR